SRAPRPAATVLDGQDARRSTAPFSPNSPFVRPYVNILLRRGRNPLAKATSHAKAVNHLKKSDPVLAAIIERVGPYRMQYGEPTFHSLAESILYQQLNGKAAATIFDRFTALAG